MNIMSHTHRKRHPETHNSKCHAELALGYPYLSLLIERPQYEHHENFSGHKNGIFYSITTEIEETSILQISMSHWFYSS